MQYQERFVKQRNELIEHYSRGFDVVPSSKKALVKEITQGVQEYISNKGYFKLNSGEKQKLQLDNTFAKDVVNRIPMNWENSVIKDVLRMHAEKRTKNKVA
jgi:hypothetical protein